MRVLYANDNWSGTAGVAALGNTKSFITQIRKLVDLLRYLEQGRRYKCR